MSHGLTLSRAVRARRLLLPALAVIPALLAAVGCRGGEGSAPAPVTAAQARHLVLITIDTLRADRVGAYGHAAARTPAMDRLAREGARFTHAFTTAPITLPAHASLLTGRYPPGHDARHNGIAMPATVPTLATTLGGAGFAHRGVRVGISPRSTVRVDVRLRRLRRRAAARRRSAAAERASGRGDRAQGRRMARRARMRSGCSCGCTCSSLMPRTATPPIGARSPCATTRRSPRPIKPSARLVEALGERAASTLIVLTSDHGEAFGEHGEIGHSIFVYDTTLRVPLILRGPGVAAGTTVDAATCRWSTSRRPSSRCSGCRRSTPTGSRSARRSPAARPATVSSTPSHSRRCSTSGGARCAASATGPGSTSLPLAPSCTRSIRIRRDGQSRRRRSAACRAAAPAGGCIRQRRAAGRVRRP